MLGWLERDRQSTLYCPAMGGRSGGGCSSGGDTHTGPNGADDGSDNVGGGGGGARSMTLLGGGVWAVGYPVGGVAAAGWAVWGGERLEAAMATAGGTPTALAAALAAPPGLRRLRTARRLRWKAAEGGTVVGWRSGGSLAGDGLWCGGGDGGERT